MTRSTRSTHSWVILPLASHVAPFQPHGLASFAHPSAPRAVWLLDRYTSIIAQNWSAAPTPVELPFTSGVS
jgi:hypothetical protein